MDQPTFYRWFRQAAGSLGVQDVSLRFMSPSQARGELGRYELGSNTIYIDETKLNSDQIAINIALHELAHAIVYRKNSEYFERREGKLSFDLHNPLATNALNKLEFHQGHGETWRKTAANLGADINSYVDRETNSSPFSQLRRGLGFRH